MWNAGQPAAGSSSPTCGSGAGKAGGSTPRHSRGGPWALACPACSASRCAPSRTCGAWSASRPAPPARQGGQRWQNACPIAARRSGRRSSQLALGAIRRSAPLISALPPSPAAQLRLTRPPSRKSRAGAGRSGGRSCALGPRQGSACQRWSAPTGRGEACAFRPHAVPRHGRGR